MSIYSSVEDHRSMAFDTIRNTAYGRAIEAAVNEDSVVIDLGAGLGMLGLLAARAGARKVYLVEPSPVIEITRRVVRENGFDNVEVVAATAETMNLPEKADLIISVFTGNFLLTEDLLPSLFHARDRFLKPGGKMIPDRAQMRVAPVSVQEFYAQHVACWGVTDVAPGGSFDYSAVRRYAANTVFYDTAERMKPELLAPACTLLELDFLTANSTDCDSTCVAAVTRPGQCHGWLGWFRMRLGEQWLSTSPNAPAMHWCQVLLPLEPAVVVNAGEEMGLHLRRSLKGDWNWTANTPSDEQRRSTFLSAPPSLARLQKLAEDYQPVSGVEGKAAAYVLSCFSGNKNATLIARDLRRELPARFSNEEEALAFVRDLVEKYG